MRSSRATRSAAVPARSPRRGLRVLAPGAAALALALVAAACSSGPSEPSASQGTTGSRTVPASVASIPLTTQTGAVTDLAAFKGRTVMVVPFLSLCQDVCPFTTGNLLQVQHSIDAAKQNGDVAVIEYSVDPERDTPARLAAYAKLEGISWTLTTSSPENTAALEKYFGVVATKQPEGTPPGIDWWTGQPLTYDVGHTDGYAILDAKGVERFVSGATPSFHGTLNPTIEAFLSDDGKSALKDPPKNGWTPADALSAISWVSGTTIPVAAG